MVPLEVWLLAGAVLAFGSSLWLVAQRDKRGMRALESLADQNGWDCRSAAPHGLTMQLAEIAHVEPLAEARLFLAGPAASGPFQMLAASERPGGGEGGPREWTFLHLRTSAVCRGLWVSPSRSFCSRGGGEARDEVAFARRFQVGCVDTEDYEIVDDELRSLLLRPLVPVRIGWMEQDLVIAFPRGVSSPRAVQAFMGYGDALAARLTRPRRSVSGAIAATDEASTRGRVVV